MTDAVLYEKRGPIAWITFNRPDALNALNSQVRELLPRHLRAAEADPEVRVTVLRGAGERAFCAGADIKEFGRSESPAQLRQDRVYGSWIRPFDDSTKPIIASIHGFCLGGGLEIALACDIRIAARDASFAFPETGLGLVTGVGGSQRLLRITGIGQAMDMMLTGERISAERALALNIVTRVTDRATLEQETEALAQRLIARPPLALSFAKELVRKGGDLELAAGIRLELDLLALLLNTEDRLEAAQAFREKRAPKFTGR